MSDFENLNIDQLSVVVRSGSLASLPDEYQEYYSLMELVRGLRAKNAIGKNIITKAGIIKLLKTEHRLSDYFARKIYSDSLNFFYAQEHVRPEAFANLYADKLDDAAAVALQTGQLDIYKDMIKEAAKLRGCYDKKPDGIPKELYRKPFVIYTTNVEDIGGTSEDVKELERQLDALPDIPVVKLNRVKAEANIPGYDFDVMKMIAEDFEEFSADEDKKN